jgi:hypothetical protein
VVAIDIPLKIDLKVEQGYTVRGLKFRVGRTYRTNVHLDFIRPGRPVENGYLQSFNGKLRDECLNLEAFFTLADARHKLGLWRQDYNHHRPHSSLADRTLAEFAATWRDGNDAACVRLENPSRFTFPPHDDGCYPKN